MPKPTKRITLNGTIISDSNSFIYRWLGIQATSPSMVATALEEAAGEPVEVLINSGGGSVFAGSEIYTLLKDYQGEIVGKITGLAASAASVAAMGVKRLLISPTAQIMIHNSSTGTDGDRHTHNQQSEMLLSVDEAMTNAYSLKTGKSKEELLALMDKETWFNAQKAVELGFADEIMFSDAGSDVSNSTTSFVELPQAVIDKVRNQLLKGGNSPESSLTQPGSEPQSNKTAPTSAEGDDEEVKDLAELKAKHPELYQAAVQEGVSAERTRITDLNALADAPGAAEIVAKAITEGKTAAQAAVDIVTASKSRVATVGNDRAADSTASNAAMVPAEDPTPDKPTEEEQANAHADGIIAEVNKLRGVKQ